MAFWPNRTTKKKTKKKQHCWIIIYFFNSVWVLQFSSMISTPAKLVYTLLKTKTLTKCILFQTLNRFAVWRAVSSLAPLAGAARADVSAAAAAATRAEREGIAPLLTSIWAARAHRTQQHQRTTSPGVASEPEVRAMQHGRHLNSNHISSNYF